MPAPGFGRAVGTLLAGGALAQALPLLAGPLLARLVTATEFGHAQVFLQVATNVAVIACLRYEFALPLARDSGEAAALQRLCVALLLATTVLAGVGAAIWRAVGGDAWVLWLPVAVFVFGGLSFATLRATRAEAFAAMAAARVLQQAGWAGFQLLSGWIHAGVQGLVVAPLASAAFAWGLLARRVPLQIETSRLAGELSAVARKHRDFPLWNTPHAFAGALQDTLAIAFIASQAGPAAAGAWGLALRYLKAPATLVGSAVSQALYPRLAQAGAGPEGRALVRRTMGLLALAAAPLVALLWAAGPWLAERAFGRGWEDAGVLARALALYIGLHFIASPLGVVTLAWGAQRWALLVSLAGQAMFVAALVGGLHWGGLRGAGWAVSLAMAAYFAWYFYRLANWPANRWTA